MRKTERDGLIGTIFLLLVLIASCFTAWFIYLLVKVAQYVGAWPF